MHTYVCIQVKMVLTDVPLHTVQLEGLFGECHSSLVALAQQYLEVTKQPLVCDRSTTLNSLWC